MGAEEGAVEFSRNRAARRRARLVMSLAGIQKRPTAAPPACAEPLVLSAEVSDLSGPLWLGRILGKELPDIPNHFLFVEQLRVVELN